MVWVVLDYYRIPSRIVQNEHKMLFLKPVQSGKFPVNLRAASRCRRTSALPAQDTVHLELSSASVILELPALLSVRDLSPPAALPWLKLSHPDSLPLNARTLTYLFQKPPTPRDIVTIAMISFFN
ncbi:hypothetical protein CBL_02708 [Carabus blaptoides fortunei]